MTVEDCTSKSGEYSVQKCHERENTRLLAELIASEMFPELSARRLNIEFVT